MQITVKQLKQLIREAVEEAYNEGEMEEETVEECGYDMSAEKEDGGPLRRGRGDMEQDERFLEEYLAEAKKAKKAKKAKEDKKPAKKLPAFIVKAQEKAAAKKKADAEAAKKKPVAKK